MKMKSLITATVILGATLVVPATRANSIVLNQNSYSYQDGGEFTAITSQNFLGNYVSGVTAINGGFETFCVEASVTFNPGVTYSYNLSGSDSQGRALTAGAALLYYEFGTGSLTPFHYSGASRSSDAGQLQSALWMLQGNQSGGAAFPNGGIGNPFYNWALGQLGGATNAFAANNGLYPVEILQLWDDAGKDHQNQLVLDTTSQSQRVPDAGATLGMLALGLAGLLIAASRIRKPSLSA